MNRFGFSAKKPLQEQNNHRQSDHLGYGFTPSVRPSGSGFSSAKGGGGLINSVGSHHYHNNGQHSASSAFSHGISSMRKLSTGGKLSHGGGGGGHLGMAAPSTGKSIRSMAGGGGGAFASARKTPTSKLFGMTPQQTRASFSQGGGGVGGFSASASARRSSTRGGKGSAERPLSDQAFHRKCQEKIAAFLDRKEYPFQLSHKQLLRPSQADVSRLFEFLFSFFVADGAPRIEIRNGPSTSIDVVVPKMLAELGFPYTLKRSDLVSFSGGRQLGAILEALCFVIDTINYIDNVDISRFSRPEETDEFMDISSQLREISMANIGGGGGGQHQYGGGGMNENEDGMNDDGEEDIDREQLARLASSFFGTAAEVEKLTAAQGPLEERLKNLEKEISRLVELPKEIQEYKEENENYDKYLAEVASKDSDHQRIRAELLAEVQEKEASLEKAAEEKRRLQTAVDGQKELVVEFRLAKERRRQIEAEAEETKAAVTALNESLITASLEVNTARTLNRALIDDIEDVIGVFFGQLKASKVNMASADSGFAASFEADGEWRSLAAQLAAYRDWTVEAPSDELVREVAAFGTRFQEKFVDFKHRLLKHLSAFKGTASIEVICERQKLARELETDRQRLAEEEAALGALVAEKERTEEEGEAAVGRLNEAVHQAKVAIVADERAAEALAAEVAGLEEAAERAEAEISRRRAHWARSVMAERAKRTEAALAEWAAASEALLEQGRAAAAEKEQRLAALRAYNTKKKVQKKVTSAVADVAEVMEAVENIAIEE